MTAVPERCRHPTAPGGQINKGVAHMRLTHTSIAPLAALLAAATLAAPATARPQSTYELPQYFRTEAADGRGAHSTYTLPRDFRSEAADGRGAHSTYTLPQAFRTADSREAAKGRGTFNAPGVTVVKLALPSPSPDGGVDWADAAIGAGGATGLLAITLAGAMTMRRRHVGARAAVS
jgi:hypothetical protein